MYIYIEGIGRRGITAMAGDARRRPMASSNYNDVISPEPGGILAKWHRKSHINGGDVACRFYRASVKACIEPIFYL